LKSWKGKMMSDDDFIPSTPDPNYVAIATAVIRGILQIAAGFGFTWALTVTGSQVMMIATGVVMLMTLAWSVWQKISQARAVHIAAVASASKRRPVEASPPPPIP
jgi:tetrahydromethanopterin S-methyltransferase subunit D